MSSPSIELPPEKSGASGSLTGIAVGVLLLLIAAASYFGNVAGLPFGIHLAFSVALAIVGIAFIIQSMVPLASPQDFMGGIFLLVLAAIAIFGTLKLNFYTTTGVGPGMMPRGVGGLVGLCGIVLIFQSFFVKGAGLDRWSFRGLFFVLGAALLFSWTIRPLGLMIAGPLAVIVSGFADRDTRFIEVVIYGILLTLGCWLLFSLALRLPIPVWPTAMPWPISDYIKL